MFGLGAIELLLFLPAMLVVPASVFYLGLRWVRAQEKRNTDSAQVAALATRVAELEEALGDLGAHIKRLDEGHDFTTRLLQERRSADAPRANTGG